jgi:hypothetical protein
MARISRAHGSSRTLDPKCANRKFKGQAVHIVDSPEMNVIKRYIKTAKMSVLSCLSHPLKFDQMYNVPQPHVKVFDQINIIETLIHDNSTDKNIMAFKISSSLYAGRVENKSIYNQGGILLLPDFGDNNSNAALALLQEVFTEHSTHLFDTPQHSWLEKYQPISVVRLQTEHKSIIDETLSRLKEISEQIESERERYAWLVGLLVSTGDQFAADGAQALRFLGFDVEEVDNTLNAGERRREDYRIRDKVTGYFAIGEAKTTGKGRGASEDFITKTQTHQARYARENNQAPPPALLIVNYAIDLDPTQRIGRFYQPEVEERLSDNAITAISSVALFILCQALLSGQLSQEKIRRFLASGRSLIASVTIDDII